MNKLKNLSIIRYTVILIVWILFYALIPISAYGKTFTWQDNFDDGTLDDWIITGRHYVASTDTYTKWNGSVSATSGRLAYVTENHWENWANNRIMNITWCWHQSPLIFGQWSLDIFSAEDNFLMINIVHVSDPNIIRDDNNLANATFIYGIYILTASYEPERPSAAFVYGDFTSPTGVTVKDFTGEPCFIFIKSGKNISYTVFAIEEFPTEILTTDILTIHITRDNSSKFTFFVEDKVIFSVTDTSPPSTSLDTEGYYFGVSSFGGGSWIDNINVSDTIPTTTTTTTTNTTTTIDKTTTHISSSWTPMIILMSVVILLISRKKNKNK